MTRLRRLTRGYGYEVALGVALLPAYALLAWRAPLLRDPENLLDASQHIVEIGILAVAMTPIIISGGIDLSVGSLVGMCGIVLGYAWQAGVPLWAAALLAVLAGALAGALNGAAVTRGRVPPLVVTLATMAIFRGAAYAISQARPVSGFPVWFEDLGQSYVRLWPTPWQAPAQLLVFLVVAALGGFFLHATVYGRYVYAVGSNERAARFAAVPVHRVKLLLYTLSGSAAGLAAVVFVARTGAAKADAAAGYELDVITCVVLGGTRITGGRGTPAGTLLGVVAVLLARTGLGYAGVPDVWRTLLLGVLLILTACAGPLLAGRRR